MAKKKRIDLSIRKQFTIVTGLVLLLVAFGFFVAWADMTTGGRFVRTASFPDVTIKGESVCLPHRDTSGPQTSECAQGIKTSDGTFYAISGIKDRNSDNSIEVTGTLTPTPWTSKYAVSGVITVE